MQGTFSHELLGGFIGATSSSVAGTGLSVIIALASDVSLFSLFFYHTFRLLHSQGSVFRNKYFRRGNSDIEGETEFNLEAKTNEN